MFNISFHSSLNKMVVTQFKTHWMPQSLLRSQSTYSRKNFFVFFVGIIQTESLPQNQKIRSLHILHSTPKIIRFFMKKFFSTNYSDTAFNIGLLLLRLAAGAMIIPHGYSKLKGFSKMSSQFSDPFHIGQTLSLSLTIFAEFFCGMLIVLGLFTRLASIPLIIAMSVAVLYAHHGDIFGKGQTASLFLAIFLTILFVGPGRASIDGMMGK
jgi:putative oxidoreductase